MDVAYWGEYEAVMESIRTGELLAFERWGQGGRRDGEEVRAMQMLRWMADNMTVEMDAAGNVKPSKKRSREKIDGMVAMIMGLDRALRNEGRPSVYETRGLIVL